MSEESHEKHAPVVIVTGATRGYGLACVHAIYKERKDVRIIATGRDKSALARLEAEFTGKQAQIVSVPGDITDTAVRARIVNTAVERFGCIDAIVHNAGIVDPLGPICPSQKDDIKVNESEANAEDVVHAFNVNIAAVVGLTRAAAGALRKSNGRVVLVSSGCATRAIYGMGIYGMTKSALNMLAQCLAVEEHNVTTVAMRPGVLDTDMQRQLREAGPQAIGSDAHDFFVSMHRDGTLVDPLLSARSVALLTLYSTKDMSGKFFDWEDEVIANLSTTQLSPKK